MDSNVLRFSSLAVSFLVGICSEFAATLIWKRLRTPWDIPWSQRIRRDLKPGIRGAKDLDRLTDLLASVVSWLSTNDTEQINQIRHVLWEQIVYIKIEKLSYRVLYSETTDKKLWAIRQLSQLDNDKAQRAIKAISENPVTEDCIRTVAKQFLNDD